MKAVGLDIKDLRQRTVWLSDNGFVIAGSIIPSGLSADRYCCPPAPGERSDPFWHSHEFVPGLTTGIDNGFVAWPDLVAEPVLAHVFPDVLNRVRFRCIRWQGQQHDVVGPFQPR